MKNKTTRRVVTGNNSEGKSYFVLDGPTPGRFDIGVLQSNEVWIDEPGRPGPPDTSNPIDIGAGDAVVQRSTRHAWHNRSDQPCTVAFVLISSPNYT
jgi:hypothetical protein